MPPPALLNLYCTPLDVYEYIGIEAAQLRLDDQSRASGQQIQTSADAAVGATSLTINALQYPLLRGSNLVFSNAAMEEPVEATLSAVANVGSVSLTVTALETAIPSGAIAIDNGVNVWLAGMLAKACKYGTDRVNLYCANRYPTTQLVRSWNVNQWATVFASYWLSTRLFRAAPQQIKDAYDEAMLEVKDVQASRTNINGIGTNTSGWPFLSNVTVDQTYIVAKARVETQISEPTPTQYYQRVDWNSVWLFEW